MIIADPMIDPESGAELDEPDMNRQGSWVPFEPKRKE